MQPKRRLLFCVSWLCISCLSCVILAQPTFELSYRSEQAAPFSGGVIMEGSGDIQEWPNLEVYLEQVWKEQGIQAPSILGQQFDTSGMRVFQPLLPFRAGMRYFVKAGDVATYSFQVPDAKDETPPKLLGIYPSAAEIPANQLKFYLLFDRPMRKGNVYRHLRLEAADGGSEMPFLPLQPELWDSSRQRLTLWFDPGRLKRDLVLNQSQGPPLQLGQTYTLHVDREWRDTRSLTLDKSYTHSFIVGSSDRDSPDPKHWNIIPPPAKTHDTLHIHFGEALDFALAQSAIDILTDDQQRVSGQIIVGKDQQSWHFVPAVSWGAGNYQIRIKATLEDLAGNNLNRLFDTDLQKAKPAIKKDFYWLPFRIRMD